MDELTTSRLAAWWQEQSDETRERMVALDEDDYLPADLVTSLASAGVFVVSDAYFPSVSAGPRGFPQSSEIREFLDARRAEGA